jgi:hypothetical protein
MNDHTMTWLLVNKIRFERNRSREDLTTTVRHAAQSMVYWKACNSEINVCEEGYWNSASVCSIQRKNLGAQAPEGFPQ